MLRHLRIENFKAWKDTGEMELAPISVFLGTNSSGKSSIIQFLMMLKQTVQDPDPFVVLNTGDEKSIVDVGLPSHMLYRHDTSRRLRFSYDWDIDTPFRFGKDSFFSDDVRQKLTSTKDGNEYQYGTNARFHCSLNIKNEGVESWRLLYKGYRISHDFYTGFSVSVQESETFRDSTGYEGTLKGLPFDVPGVPIPVQQYGFYEFIANNASNIPLLFIQTLNSLQFNLFSSMFYLGPLRDRTSRLYTWKGTGPSDVGIDGSKAVFAMLNARLDFRKFQFPDSKSEYEIDTAVAVMLKKMGLIEQFQVHRIGPERMEYEVQVQTKGSPVWADLPDVGCGVSQVLPVLVELFYAPPGSILLMEQPELHLHPSAQAALADVMIDAVQAKENGKPRNIQLIIETHSEYFLRRLQRRVAEEVIDENTVRGYFCDSSTDPFQMKRLELDAYGNILNWPEDFFGDMAGDIFHQAEAAFGRKKDEYEKNAESH